MKKYLIGFIVILILLTSCGNTTKVKSTTDIKLFMSAYPTTIDPSKGSDLSGEIILKNILEPLIRIDETADGNPIIVAAGAKKWTQSDDGLTYTFHLNNNVWQDGKPVTSEDYAYGIRRSVLPETKCPYVNVVYPVKNATQISEGKLPVSELGVLTPDAKTLIIKLEQPTPYFFQMIRLRPYYPQREDYVKKYGSAYGTTVEATPTCGPFIITKADKASPKEEAAIECKKHLTFWNASFISIDNISWYIRPTTIEDFEQAKTAIATIDNPENRKKLLKDASFNYYVELQPRTTFFLASCHEGSITRNTKVRRAISAALDRYEFIDAVNQGVPQPANSFCPPSLRNLGEIFNDGKNSPVDALLADIKDPRSVFIEGIQELGLGSDPSKVTLHLTQGSLNTTAKRSFIFAKMNLEKILGCKVDTKLSEWGAFRQTINDGTYELAYFSWGSGFDDPLSMFEIFWSKSRNYNTGWKHLRYDNLIEQAQKETNIQQRKKILQQIDNILVNEEAIVIPVSFTVRHTFTQGYLQGFETYYFNSMGCQRYKIINNSATKDS